MTDEEFLRFFVEGQGYIQQPANSDDYKVSQWVNVADRLPPDNWYGLVITDVRPDRPVVAHTADERYRREFPYSDYFIGKWRQSILTCERMREKAQIVLWLETDELYPEIPKIDNAEIQQQDSTDRQSKINHATKQIRCWQNRLADLIHNR